MLHEKKEDIGLNMQKNKKIMSVKLFLLKTSHLMNNKYNHHHKKLFYVKD